MTRGEVRSTLFVLVVVVVAVIALWPRGSGTSDAADTSAAGGAADPAAASSLAQDPRPAPPDPAALATARTAAALAPCPAAPRGASARSAPSAPTASPLDGLVLDCLGGPGAVDLGPALAGRTTLVNLWASWCGPCRAEIPALSAYAAEPDAASVLGVAVADSPVPALELLRGLGAHYPSVSDPDRTLAARTGAPPILPATVLVRPDGTVAPLPPEVFTDAAAVRRAVDGAARGAS